jgi:branched-chain amino acid transport system permease protein
VQSGFGGLKRLRRRRVGDDGRLLRRRLADATEQPLNQARTGDGRAQACAGGRAQALLLGGARELTAQTWMHHGEEPPSVELRTSHMLRYVPEAYTLAIPNRVSGRHGTTSARVLALFALAAVVPLFAGTNVDVMNNLVLALAYVVMALGLNVIVGFAGLLDLGYVAFFAIGSYTAAYLGSGFWANAGGAGHGISLLVSNSVGATPGIHVNFLLVLAAAGAAAALAGALIGVPALRLRGDYIGIVTLAFGEIIGQVVSNGQTIHLFGGTLTSGPSGIGPIDPIELPLIGRFGPLDLRTWYWFALAMVAIALAVNVNLRDSRIGRAWAALRDDEETAACTGIPIVRTKLLAYATGAAFGGVSGAFLASYIGAVEPGQFEFSFSLFVLAMVVLGGTGSIAGAVLGAIVISLINNYVLTDVLNDATDLSLGVYGVILVLVTLLRPQGLLPARSGGRYQ